MPRRIRTTLPVSVGRERVAAIVGSGRRAGARHRERACRRRRRSGHRRREPVRHAVDDDRYLVGLQVVDRAHGDRLVRGTGVAAREERRIDTAGVTHRDCDDDALAHELVRHDRGRLLRPRRIVVADAHVHDLRAVLVRALERRDDDVVVDAAVATEHAVGEELHLRCDAGHAVGVRSVCADDPRDMRAVARTGGCCVTGGHAGIGEERVARCRIGIGRRHRIERLVGRRSVVQIADEVVPTDDAAVGIAEVGTAAEVRVRVVDTRVDDCDLDVLALVRADAARKRVDTDLRVRALICRLSGDLLIRRDRERAHRIHPGDSRHRPEAADLLERDANRDAVPQRPERLTRRDLQPHRGCCRVERVLRFLDTFRGAALGGRRPRELDEPRRRGLVVRPRGRDRLCRVGAGEPRQD